MSAIAINTPPLKAFAIPSTIGDSLKDYDFTGMTPSNAASKKAITMKILLSAFGLNIYNQ